jgi:hypothetical protein
MKQKSQFFLVGKQFSRIFFYYSEDLFYFFTPQQWLQKTFFVAASKCFCRIKLMIEKGISCFQFVVKILSGPRSPVKIHVKFFSNFKKSVFVASNQV